MTPWIVLGVILFAVVFCFTIGAMSCSSAVHSLSNFGMGSVEEGLTDGPTVAVIDISGTSNTMARPALLKVFRRFSIRLKKTTISKPLFCASIPAAAPQRRARKWLNT